MTVFNVMIDTRNEEGEVVQEIESRYASLDLARARVSRINTEVDESGQFTFHNMVAWLEIEEATIAGGEDRSGRRPGGRKLLTNEQVIEIRTRAATGEKQADIAADFGVSRQNISMIVQGKTYGYV